MDWTGRTEVERIPGKVSGVPILKHTRVQAEIVLENYQHGESVEDIAYNYDLDPNQIIAVLAFAGKSASLKSKPKARG